MPIANALKNLSSQVLQELLADQRQWHWQLSPPLLECLQSKPDDQSIIARPTAEMATYLETMLYEPHPLLPAASLYLLHVVDATRAQGQVSSWPSSSQKFSALTQEVAAAIAQTSTVALPDCPTLEKLVYLYNSDFFSGVHEETLIELAHRAIVKTYSTEELITEEGDTCRELLVLIAGAAEISLPQADNSIRTTPVLPGQMLDELEVLSHSVLSNTIVATAPHTRILALPVDTFDDIFDRDPDFARRILELESSHLRQLVQQQN